MAEKKAPRKNPCPDCTFCQYCADERCALCRSPRSPKKKDGRKCAAHKPLFLKF